MNEEADKRLAMVMEMSASTLLGAQGLLLQLTKKYPPIPRHNHQLTLREGKLVVNLLHVTPCESITLDAEDLAKPVVQLVLEIAALVPREPPKPAA